MMEHTITRFTRTVGFAWSLRNDPLPTAPRHTGTPRQVRAALAADSEYRTYGAGKINEVWFIDGKPIVDVRDWQDARKDAGKLAYVISSDIWLLTLAPGDPAYDKDCRLNRFVVITNE